MFKFMFKMLSIFFVCFSVLNPYMVEASGGVVIKPTVFYTKGTKTKTGGRLPIPILNEKEDPTGLTIKHRTKIRVSLLNDRGKIYLPGLGQKPHPSRLVYVEGISSPQSPLKNIVTGYIYAYQLSKYATVPSQGSKYKPPPKYYPPYPPTRKDYRPIDIGDLSDDPQTDIPFIIKSFHKGLCSIYQENKTNKRRALLDGWHRLIDDLPSSHQELGNMAMHVDLTARTILYEAHPSGRLSHRHKNQGRCEWDIIALSIRNRALTCKPHFKCDYPGDYTGVATAPTQYLIWKPYNVRKTDINSCFLSEDTDFPELQSSMKPKTTLYDLRKRDFKKLLQRVPKVLGFYKSLEERVDGSYLTNLFQVTRINEKPPMSDKPNEQLKHLKTYHHYFHPGGLNNCPVDKYPYTQYLKAAYISMDQGSFTDFGLLIDERIFKKEIDNHGNWKFSIKQTSDREVHYAPSTDFFKGTPRVNEDFFEDLNTSYTCLPQGRIPSCLSEKEAQSKTGKRVPTFWFGSEVKDIVRHFLVETRGFELPKGWDKTNPSEGAFIGLRCLSDDLKDEDRKQPFPEFHGICDKHFMPMANIQ